MFQSLLLQLVALPVLVLGDQRIIGGSSVKITDHPWQVAIEIKGLLLGSECSGAIYSMKYILTAAICVDDHGTADIKVRVGTSRRGAEGLVAGVCAKKIHGQFSSTRFDNNLALLLLCEPLTASESVAAIPLTDQEPEDHTAATVAGWGARRVGLLPSSPQELHSIEVKVYNRKECASDWRWEFWMTGINELTICTRAEGKGACRSDTGAPLVVDSKLVGILSKPGCSSWPDVYSNVIRNKDWLETNTKE